MDKSQLKTIIRAARRAALDELRELYMEVYGAHFAGSVTPERARASIISACREMLERGKMNHLAAQGQEKIMEEILKQILATNEKQVEILTRIVKALEGSPAPAKPYTSAGPVPTKKEIKEQDAARVKEKDGTVVFKPVDDGNGGKKLEEVKSEPTITIEQLREMATKYSAAFGMEDLLKLNQKYGGAKKLSQVPAEQYTMLHEEMKSRLDRENGSKATEKPLSLDEVKAKAKVFMDKNGQGALVALLKAFKAEKISALPAEQYPAFVEAISNA